MHYRNWIALGHDIVAAAIAWYLAYWLRFNTEIPPYNIPNMLGTMLWVVPLQAVIFFGAGMYRSMWSYARLPDLLRIVIAAALSTLAIALVLLLLPHEEPPVPRSVILLDPMLLILILGGTRLGFRVWNESRIRNASSSQDWSVVILGAGSAATDLLNSLARTGLWRVLGLFDDNPAKRGRQIQGANVLGALEELVDLAPSLGARRAIISMPSVSHQSRRRALAICRRAGVQALTVPSYQDLLSGKAIVSQVRSIELDDLLARDPALLNEGRLREWIHGRRVFVTGDGGSIGSELCRLIACFEPERLTLLEDNDLALHRAEEEFAEQHPRIKLQGVIDDIKNSARAIRMLAAHRPAIVFHAAACKHVPQMEADSAREAIQNKVLGTLHLAEAAIAHGVEKFVLVSADTGGDPTDIIGASKRLAEIVCQGLQTLENTRFIIARFGKVLVSASTEIHKFREQIARGGPVTIASPDMTYYFSSVPEAARLMLQAGLMGCGGEIFVFDTGEPIKIVDLARDYIWLSGHSVADIGIEFTDIRSGENLLRELIADNEDSLPTSHPRLRIVKSRAALDATWQEKLVESLEQGNLGADQTPGERVQRVISLADTARRVR